MTCLVWAATLKPSTQFVGPQAGIGGLGRCGRSWNRRRGCRAGAAPTGRRGTTLFIDGGSGGVGATASQIAKARGATVIASASEANQDYLREIGAIPVVYGEGMVERARALVVDKIDAVLDTAGKTPIEDLISLAPEPAQVVSIANFEPPHPERGCR